MKNMNNAKVEEKNNSSIVIESVIDIKLIDKNKKVGFSKYYELECYFRCIVNVYCM